MTVSKYLLIEVLRLNNNTMNEEKYHMHNVIYDTLMQNTQHEVLEVFDIVNPCISRDEISFDYRGKHIFIRIMVDNL